MKDNLAIFFRNGSKPVPRALRMMKVAEDLGYKSVFCGAIRENDIESSGIWEGFKFYRVGSKYPLLNGKGLITYLKYTFIFNFYLYRFFKKKSPKILVASDFEVMIPALLYSLIFRVSLIYNIHDNLAQRYNVNKITYFFLNCLEGLAVLMSNAALVPEEFRKSSLPKWCIHKISIVKNIPGKISFSEPKFDGNKIKLFYGGWLNYNRGIKQLIELANSNDLFELEIAGSGSISIINEIKSNKNITYLGYLTHEESLRKTREAHFIPIFYNPKILINKYAASNKLAETLAVGRPLLVNSELVILNSFKSYDCIISDKYENINNIGHTLIEIFNDRDKYLEVCKKSRKLYEKYYNWDEAYKEMKRIILK